MRGTSWRGGSTVEHRGGGGEGGLLESSNGSLLSRVLYRFSMYFFWSSNVIFLQLLAHVFTTELGIIQTGVEKHILWVPRNDMIFVR